MAELVMPRLSDTMEEGTILRWLIADGAAVTRGQEIVEIETDKATMTYESDLEGTVEILASEGDTLAVGTVIARVAPAGAEESSASEADLGPASAGVGAGAEDAGARTATPNGPPAATGEPAGARALASAPAGAGNGPAAAGATSPPAPPQPDPAAQAGAGVDTSAARVKASPLARRLARERHLDLSALSGSGPGGRIVKADVEAAPAQGETAGARAGDAGAQRAGGAGAARATGAGGAAGGAAAGTGAEGAGGGELEGVMRAKGASTELELSRTQQTIARRMAESKATIPHFTLEIDIDVERCRQLRAELKRLADGSSGAERVPTYNDMVVKASALALRDHPRANSSYRDGRLKVHSRVNVGVAVAVDADRPSGGALVVPTVFDADTKSLGEIARETRALAERVRDGSITPPELGGGTFTVSNLGMFGIKSFAAIINPPQVAILSVGSVAPRPVVFEDALIARHTMTATLSCDHRVLYGADAARFLSRIRELLEQPSSLTL